MSNGSSVLDESASALFAYAAPENLEQERLFQEQLKNDVIEQRRLQQVHMELNAQLQQAKMELKAREDALRQVEESLDELFVYYESLKRALKTKTIYGYRCVNWRFSYVRQN